MKKSWNVDVNGTKHTIEYKNNGFGQKIIVDGDIRKVKSSNWFVVLIDYAIKIGDTTCNLVAVGNKVDLAVNGVFLGSGETYEPVNNAPAWTWVLVGLSCIGGWFFAGLMGIVIGIVFSVQYIQQAIKQKTGMVIGLFIANMLIIAVLGFLVLNFMM